MAQRTEVMNEEWEAEKNRDPSLRVPSKGWHPMLQDCPCLAVSRRWFRIV